MLENDSFFETSNGAFPSSSESESVKESSSLASDSNMSLSHGFKSNNMDSNSSKVFTDDTIFSDKTVEVGYNSFSYHHSDITQAGNNLDFFENAEGKDSSELVYYGWPEIGNFDDVDRMFSSCDSTFGLEARKEDELGWFSSADDIAESRDMLESDFEFPSPKSKAAENISENHDSSKRYSICDSATTSGPLRCKDSSWMSAESDPIVSYVNGPAMVDCKDVFHSIEQITEHKKQFQVQNQPRGKTKEEQYFGNGSFSSAGNLSNEVLQQSPGGACHEGSSSVYVQQQVSGITTGSLKNLTSYLSTSNRQLSALVDETEKLEKLQNSHGSRSSSNCSNKDATMMIHASLCERGSTPSEQGHCSGDKLENHSDSKGGCLVVPAELGLSNINVKGSRTMSSGLDDISLEAASFRQLQFVMEQLDVRTKLCIQDSLYRLARSAEQRHNHANLNGVYEDQRGDTGELMGEGTNKCTSFMDIETDTNPIDRSIAHLLFHRPSESSAIPAQDSLQLKSPDMVHGSVINVPVMIETLVISEETASEMELSRS